MNLFISHLDEQQRRWYAALEAQKSGYGGTTLVAKITGLSAEKIWHSRYELENDLAGQPVDRLRQAGGGRQTVKKNAVHCHRPQRSN